MLFFNILNTVLLRGISIFTAPLFTRLLGTSGYGVTQIYNTWVAVIAIVKHAANPGTLVNARWSTRRETSCATISASEPVHAGVSDFQRTGAVLYRPHFRALKLSWVF